MPSQPESFSPAPDNPNERRSPAGDYRNAPCGPNRTAMCPFPEAGVCPRTAPQAPSTVYRHGSLQPPDGHVNATSRSPRERGSPGGFGRGRNCRSDRSDARARILPQPPTSSTAKSRSGPAASRPVGTLVLAHAMILSAQNDVCEQPPGIRADAQKPGTDGASWLARPTTLRNRNIPVASARALDCHAPASRMWTCRKRLLSSISAASIAS